MVLSFGRRVGWDKDDCWFAHCCMLDEAERKQFASCGLGIAHCPSSNLRLGSGIAPVRLPDHHAWERSIQLIAALCLS